MTRRRLLVLLAAGVPTGTAAGTITGWDRLWQNLGRLERLEGLGRDPLVRLQRHFDWLPVEAGVFEQFLRDYQHIYGPLDRFSIVRPDFYVRFLLSTDFFQLDMRSADKDDGDSPAVKYFAFYEPTRGACHNPLAQPPPTDEELRGPASR